MFTRKQVHPQWCEICGFHYLDHPLPQRPGFALPEMFAADLFATQMGLSRGGAPTDLPHMSNILRNDYFAANRTSIDPEETPVVAYNQSVREKKIHEYKLRLPAAGGDVQQAITAALADKLAHYGKPNMVMDAVMVEATDEELIVYWEEEL